MGYLHEQVAFTTPLHLKTNMATLYKLVRVILNKHTIKLYHSFKNNIYIKIKGNQQQGSTSGRKYIY